MTQKLINELAYKVVGCAIEVHKIMGPGLLESIYQKCMLKELSLNGVNAKQEFRIPLIYKGEDLNSELIIDILVNDIVVARILGGVSSEFKVKHSNMELVKKPKVICNNNTALIGNIGPNKIMHIVVNAPTRPNPIKNVRFL